MKYKKIYSHILYLQIIFFFGTVAYSQINEKKHVDSLLKQAAKESEFSIFTFYSLGRLNTEFQKLAPIPIGLEYRTHRVGLTFTFYFSRCNTNLYYYNTSDPTEIKSTLYNYSIYNQSLAFDYTLKSFVFLKNVFTTGFGVSWNQITVQDINLENIPNPNAISPTAIKFIQMNSGSQFSATVFLKKYFWIRNVQSFLKLTCFIPFAYRYATVGAYETNLQRSLYNGSFVNMAMLSIHLTILSGLKYNPAKLKYL